MTTTAMRYDHGTYAAYKLDKCRCEPCREAVREYNRRRATDLTPVLVPAGPAREHIEHLARHGIGLKTVARRAGVSYSSLGKLMYGTKGRAPSARIKPATLSKILAVRPDSDADGTFTPAGPVLAIVEELLRRGWTKAAIGRHVHGPEAASLQLGDEYVTRKNAVAVKELLTLAVPARTSRWGTPVAARTTPAQPERDQEAAVGDELRELLDTGATAANRHADEVQRRQERADDYDALCNELAGILEARIDQRSWRVSAACRTKPPWMFFPARGDVRTTAAAKAICAACTVRSECLAAHLGERDGIFGGTTGRQRRQLRTEAARDTETVAVTVSTARTSAERSRDGRQLQSALVPCPHCGQRYAATIGMAKHLRAKHPDAAMAVSAA
jgi:hypothetical protein